MGDSEITVGFSEGNYQYIIEEANKKGISFDEFFGRMLAQHRILCGYGQRGQLQFEYEEEWLPLDLEEGIVRSIEKSKTRFTMDDVLLALET
jgi:hypothetical protein